MTPVDTTNHMYGYTVAGLNPGSKYYYQVVVGTQYAGGTFYTAPAAAATDVKFVSYGDTGTNGSAHNGLAGQVIALFQADPAFQTLDLNVGDWVSGDTEAYWTGEWFNSSYGNIRIQDANLSELGVRAIMKVRPHIGSGTSPNRGSRAVSIGRLIMDPCM